MWMTMYEVIHIFIYSNNIPHVIAENKGGKVLKKSYHSYSNLCMHCMFLFLRGCQSLDIQNDPTI
jgi:hypothetical protein